MIIDPWAEEAALWKRRRRVCKTDLGGERVVGPKLTPGADVLVSPACGVGDRYVHAKGCLAKSTYVDYVMPRLPNTSPQTLSVLELLLESPGSWHYGYALSQLTGLKSGTLYPILMRLADQGWLETRWAEPEQPGRPPRHTYRLTGEGAKAARTKLAEAAPSRMTRRLAPVPGSC